MASTVKRGFLNTSKGKKAIQIEPNGITNKNLSTPQAKNPTPTRIAHQSPALIGPKSLSVTLPYGKVQDVEISEEYDYGRNIYKETLQSERQDLPDDTVTVTTIPPQYMDKPDDPDGHTEWLVRGNTKKKVLDTPGHPQPIPKSRRLNFIVKPTATMGMGMFAIRDIPYGELIFSERPLLIFPRSYNLGYNVPAHYSFEQFNKVILRETEKRLELMVSRMNEKDRNAYMELANCHKEDGSGPLVGIMRTNAFAADDLADGPKGVPITNANGYIAVCKLGSRINHNCIPNTRVYFDIPSFSMQFIADADIKVGEEIAYSYHAISVAKSSKAERAKMLLPYGIVCTCPACEGTKCCFEV